MRIGEPVGHVDEIAALQHHHEPLRFVHRQRLQEERRDEREQAHVDADPEGKRQDGHDGEPGLS
jgi:hypothetical protein